MSKNKRKTANNSGYFESTAEMLSFANALQSKTRYTRLILVRQLLRKGWKWHRNVAVVVFFSFQFANFFFAHEYWVDCFSFDSISRSLFVITSLVKPMTMDLSELILFSRPTSSADKSVHIDSFNSLTILRLRVFCLYIFFAALASLSLALNNSLSVRKNDNKKKIPSVGCA